eukprot:322237-Chlamydomonas_euryale.AAC.1
MPLRLVLWPLGLRLRRPRLLRWLSAVRLGFAGHGLCACTHMHGSCKLHGGTFAATARSRPRTRRWRARCA